MVQCAFKSLNFQDNFLPFFYIIRFDSIFYSSRDEHASVYCNINWFKEKCLEFEFKQNILKLAHPLQESTKVGYQVGSPLSPACLCLE